MHNCLSSWTTFGIGGAARSVRIAKTADALSQAAASGALVLGRGSNVLVSDAGYDGDVVINRFESIRIVGRVAIVGSGTRLSKLCGVLAENGLTGLEFAAGIPATVGGAVKMNAGAFGSCIADVLLYADVLRGGKLVRLRACELGFAYRSSAIANGDVVLSAAFALRTGSPSNIMLEMSEFASIRRTAQPRGKTAGSIFKNPDGVSIGREIELAGLKGRRIGGAIVSPIHANVIVNTGGATAKDVRTLIEIIKSKLKDRGICAREEIIYIGGFD